VVDSKFVLIQRLLAYHYTQAAYKGVPLLKYWTMLRVKCSYYWDYTFMTFVYYPILTGARNQQLIYLHTEKMQLDINICVLSPFILILTSFITSGKMQKVTHLFIIVYRIVLFI